jgi:hypothetical protein
MARNLKQALVNESARKADLSKGIVNRYLGNGIWILKRLGCNQLFRASAGQGSRSYPPGMSVNVAQIQGSFQKAIVSLPPPGRRGASAGPVQTYGGGEIDALALREAAPQGLPAGATDYAVSLMGSGFLQTPVDSVRSVIFSTISNEWEQNTLVTVNSITWISTFQLDITVTSSEDLIVGTTIFYEISRS